jgi:hypothetical protein
MKNKNKGSSVWALIIVVMSIAVIVWGVLVILSIQNLPQAEAHNNYKLCVGIECHHTEGHRRMDKQTQQVVERVRGGEYQIGRGHEEGCDYTEAYAKHQPHWETCRNSDAYAREYTCYQRPIEWNNGECGVWWKSLPRSAGIPRGAM